MSDGIHSSVMKPGLRAAALAAGCVWLCLGAAAGWAQAGDEEAAQRLAAAGQQALAAGHYSEAQTDFGQLARLEPGVAEIHATLAAIDFKMRDYEASAREARTAQKLKPGLPRVDSLEGMSLAELGRYPEALP